MTRVIVVAVAVAAAGCSADRDTGEPARDPVPVRTAEVRLSRIPSTLEAGGTVRARTSTIVSSRVMAAIAEITVRPGDRVRRGQVLVRLDARQLAAGEARADASLAAAIEGSAAADAEAEGAASALTLARATHARMARLAERRVATPAEIDAAVAALREAEARLKGADARKAEIGKTIEAARAASRAAAVDASFTALGAPFDGIVTARLAEPGNMAVPGAPLLAIEDVGQFRLEVSVDAADTAGVAAGVRVPVAIAGLPPIDGAVAEVAPAIDALAHAYTIKIELPPVPGLRSGLFGRARFAGPERLVLTVPAAAVVRRGQLTLAFVDDGGTARLRYVHVGAAAADQVLVQAGLAEHDRVVLNPPPAIVDGTRLTSEAPGKGTER